MYLADCNILIDPTMGNDFRPFCVAMAKLSVIAKTIERADGSEIDLALAMDRNPDSKPRINTAYKIFLVLTKYQDDGVVGGLDNVKLLEVPPFNQMGMPFQTHQTIRHQSPV